jgi:hypothetical protein
MRRSLPSTADSSLNWYVCLKKTSRVGEDGPGNHQQAADRGIEDWHFVSLKDALENLHADVVFQRKTSLILLVSREWKPHHFAVSGKVGFHMRIHGLQSAMMQSLGPGMTGRHPMNSVERDHPRTN